MSDNHEHPPPIISHMQDTGIIPPESDEISQERAGGGGLLMSPMIPNHYF